MAYNMKKLKGYLVSVLVFYTILVTYFLAQTAWNDDVMVKKRHGRDDGLLSVLYQEERRHLRSFKDVIKTYGGLVPLKIRDKSKRDGRLENGRKARSSASKDYADESNAINSSINNSSSSSISNNATNTFGNSSLTEAETWSRANVDIEVETRDEIAKSPGHQPNTGNIYIEEDIPKAFVNSSGSSAFHGKEKFSKNKHYKNNLQAKTNQNKGKSNSIVNDSTVTQYCGKIDAEEPNLCLSERITYSHHHHVNITTNHLSFKPFGDIFVYSAFLDTRRKPAYIRLMTTAPKGRDAIKKSGYWCAFSLPAVVSQRYYWNGAKQPYAVKPDQATQLEYYAASVGHDRKLQFYIMSCAVPERHLSTLVQFDSNRIHLVSGGKDSPVLAVNAIQERISVDVVNNQGLPWQQIVGKSLLRNITNVPNTHYDTLHNSTTASSLRGANISSSLSSDPAPASPYPNSIVSCVGPIFSTIGVVQMMEFLELTLLLGSQHIVVYTNQVSDDVRDVLAMYRYRGLVTMLPWTIPHPASIWANGRDIALNDCLYRTMYKYEFALFHDMDEYFVPRITPDLPSFINFLQSKGGLKTNKVSDLVFTSAYFAPPTKIQSKNLITLAGYTKDVSKFSTLRSVHRTYFNQHHTLRMIRPVMAYRVGSGERKKTVFNISPRYAGVNHYSKCIGNTNTNTTTSNTKKSDIIEDPGKGGGVGLPGSSGTAKKDSNSVVLCGNTKVDMYLWRFKVRLIRQVKENIRDLNSKRRD